MKREVITLERKEKQNQKTYACQFYGREAVKTLAWFFSQSLQQINELN